MNSRLSVILLLGALWAVIPNSYGEDSPKSLKVSSLDSIILKTSSYQDYKIGRALMRRKTVLFIFPGSWDPYSNHVLKVLRNLEADLAADNVQVIAVTTDSPLRIKNLQDKHDIPFVVASDPELWVARQFKMTESVAPARLEHLKQAGAGEFKVLPTLNLLFFREDGELGGQWHPTEQDLIISQERVKEMAAHLHVPPTEK